MVGRRRIDVADTLRPEILGREALQLGAVAVLSVAALLLAPRWLQVVVGAVDAVVAVVSAVGALVAWRAGRARAGLALYATGVAVFASLALLNLFG
jgi:hypothetical protein